MHCVVTAGPTYEPLDEVRRLTNFSTGRLGSELASFLVARGHKTTLLLGELATYHGESQVQRIQTFSTTADLQEQLRALSSQFVDAIFQAAAVSDFAFGKVYVRSAKGDLTEIKSGKIATEKGTLLAELAPTQKVLPQLRSWFPKARLIGWKYEVDGDRARIIKLAEKQIADSFTDACVANGLAYGKGFGLVQRGGECLHLKDTPALFEALAKFIKTQSAATAAARA
jgi:phosphopantothenoylcysteine decarboxylase/phosphopantothenate--cysteine ligase